jgi:hypothetical protein
MSPILPGFLPVSYFSSSEDENDFFDLGAKEEIDTKEDIDTEMIKNFFHIEDFHLEEEMKDFFAIASELPLASPAISCTSAAIKGLQQASFNTPLQACFSRHISRLSRQIASCRASCTGRRKRIQLCDQRNIFIGLFSQLQK